MISVIVPTIAGREKWLEQCLKGYELTVPDAEIIVVKDLPSCAEAWQEGAKRATGDYLHFTADDTVPAYDWWHSPIDMLDRGVIPVANVMEDGKRFICPTPMGVLKVMIPFLTRGMLDLDGWFLPVHHGSDDWVTYRAWRLGFPIEFCPRYIIHHYIAPEGRDGTRRRSDFKIVAKAMQDAGHLPPYYHWVANR